MILIPMAGLSLRFFRAGYKLPKYMLPLHGRTVFAHAVHSFERYFDSETFLFVARADSDEFIRGECDALGLHRYETILLDMPTSGQAETVEIGLAKAAVADDRPLTIFNIDTFRKNFTYPTAPWFIYSDGYLEVFTGGGANWSYVRPLEGDEPLVAETAEKRAISQLCCDGLYHFARAGDFRTALAAERRAMSSSELFVAPLYNHLIAIGRRIHYEIVAESDILFCGVPDEYRELSRRTELFVV